jgi:putative ABC transport system substrate-binding protein
MSYGANRSDALRLAGGYTGRILKGERPVDLPVQLATKLEVVINLTMQRRSGSTCRRLCSPAPTR